MLKSLKRKPIKKNNLNNYTDVDPIFFAEIYKEYGNEKEYLKIVENCEKPRYLVWTKYLIGKK